MPEADGSVKRLVKAIVPARVRRRLRILQGELPTRIRDAPGDLLDALRLPGRVPFPPARLRARVGATRSRAEYRASGHLAARSILEALARHQDRPMERWLDFGCGSGRLARHFLGGRPPRRFVGVDVDVEALVWCARHLPGGFVALPAAPRLPFSDGAFDLVVASSVFTHLDRLPARDWLGEIRRVLRPEGLLLASTHSERLAYMRPDLTEKDHRLLAEEGFAFRPGVGPFNDDCAFHNGAFLAREWGQILTLEEHLPFGLAGYQDLSVWRASLPAPPTGSRSSAGGSFLPRPRP